MMSSLTSEVTCPPMYAVGGLMWTVAEKQRLMNSYKKVSKEVLLLLFPDRTWDALQSRAYHLRIPRPGRRWTPEEDALLVELSRDIGFEKTLGYRKASMYFKGRTPHALNNRAYLLRKRGALISDWRDCVLRKRGRRDEEKR